MARRRPALVFLLAITACSTSEAGRIARLVEPGATPAAFTACHGHGCKLRTAVSLTPAEWQAVRDRFVPPAAEAPAERRQIAAAIALMERLVGPRAGTAEDAPADIIALDYAGQLDCVDEAVNSTTYMQMMAADGLFRWHRVGRPAARGIFIDGFPHKTAVVLEAAAGRAYAVDSWYGANGEPPFILPLGAWRDGWSPDDGPPPEG